jgi:hypothetical protein
MKRAQGMTPGAREGKRAFYANRPDAVAVWQHKLSMLLFDLGIFRVQLCAFARIAKHVH